MKRPVFSRLIKVTFLVLLTLSLFSCVSKKKFVSMENSRNQAEGRISELTDKMERYENDYNLFQNEANYNNSVKNAQIDSLQKQILHIKTDLESSSENIEDQQLSFQVEKRRLNQMLVDKNIEINKLTQQINQSNQRLNEQEKSLQDISIKLRNAETGVNTSKTEIEIVQKELDKLKVSVSNKDKEISTLKGQLRQKDEELEKLQNQVKLLKSQFGQN